MDLNNSNILLDKYLKNDLSDIEKDKLEEIFINDPELLKEYSTKKLIIDELREQLSFFEILDKAKDDNKSSRLKKIDFKSSYKLIFSIAASLLFATYIIWQPTKLSNEDVFNKFSDDILLSSNSQYHTDHNEITRDGANHLNNEINQLFLKSDYVSIINVIKMQNATLLNYQTTYQVIVSYIELENYNRAIELVDKILIANSGSFSDSNKDKLKLTKALVFIKTDSLREAKSILYELKNNDNNSSELANKILNELRWF